MNLTAVDNRIGSVDNIEDSPPFQQTQIAADSDEAQQLLQRINCICGINLLCKLTRAVQKHRGASISCLHGDTMFLALRESLERQIDKLFVLLSNQQSACRSLPEALILSSLNDWQAIKVGWQKDSFIHNYEFHSHLINLLNRMARECFRKFIPQQTENIRQQHERDSIQGGLMEITENIELLAKLRGLVTHIAVTGEMDHDSRLRVSFLSEKITRDYKRVYHCLNKIKGPMSEIQALHSLPVQKVRLDAFLKKVATEVLQPRAINANAQELFDMATEVIDINWLLVEQGLSVLEAMQFEAYLT